jgi:group I intron endonuclease
MPANFSYSVYVLKEPCSEVVRYVGISSNPVKRMSEHIKEKRPCHRVNWIQSLLSKGLLPNMEIIEEGLCKEDVLIKEKFYIRFFKSIGAILTNTTIGGEAPMADKKHTLETRLKMSEDRKGEKNPFYGKNHSKETWDKIKEKLKNRPGWNKGKVWSEEHKIKLSKTRKERIANGDIKVWNEGISRLDNEKIFELKLQGYTQKQIAEQLNCNPSSISRILNNKYKHKNR